MCNAWNHPFECTCGWGGDGHLGRRTTGNVSTNNPWVSYLRYTGYSSYTNPNASCPVCGESVFFYQSPNGGRVFFDDLGPPWPKHPCTDNPKIKILSPIYYFQTEIKRTYAWQKNGWEPFIVKAVIPQPPQFKLFNIRGEVSGEELSVYTIAKGLNEKAPFLVKKLDNKRYEVSTMQFPQFSKIAHELKFYGYSHAMDASRRRVLTTASASSHDGRKASNGARQPKLPSHAAGDQRKPQLERRPRKVMNALQLALINSGIKKNKDSI